MYGAESGTCNRQVAGYSKGGRIKAGAAATCGGTGAGARGEKWNLEYCDISSAWLFPGA